MTKADDQEEHDVMSRRNALINTIEHVQQTRQGAARLVELTDILDLDEELEHLAGGDQKRHRRIEAARRAAGLEMPVANKTTGWR